MLVVPGRIGKLCDNFNRRDILRVGGSAMIGATLANLLEWQAASAQIEAVRRGAGWGRAKSVILLYLQV